MNAKFFVAKGETRKKLITLLTKREEKLDEINAFAKRQGAECSAICDGMVLTFRLVSKVKLGPPWEQKKDGFWDVKKTTKDGKAKAKEMYALSSAVPSRFELAEIIGFDCFRGDRFLWPGVYRVKGKVLVKTDGDFKPKTKDLSRISDLEFEKLTAKA